MQQSFPMLRSSVVLLDKAREQQLCAGGEKKKALNFIFSPDKLAFAICF